MNILVTGGLGFIGSNFIHHVLRETDWNVVNLDKVTYAGNHDNLPTDNLCTGTSGSSRLEFFEGDVCDDELVMYLLHDYTINTVVHFAAETHVDKSIMKKGQSIKAQKSFIATNVQGPATLVACVQEHMAQLQKTHGDNIPEYKRFKRFIHISTDEVYGAKLTGISKEDDPVTPTKENPYALTKATADLWVQNAMEASGVPLIVVRPSNAYGPRQHIEKFLPLSITNVLEGKPIPLYGDGQQKRQWLYVSDLYEGIAALLAKGRVGEIYNIGGDGEEITNQCVAKMVLAALGKDNSFIKHITDRPHHDIRYCIASGKITAHTGWKPQVSFADGLGATVQWYTDHEQWWKKVKYGEESQHWLKEQYKKR